MTDVLVIILCTIQGATLRTGGIEMTDWEYWVIFACTLGILTVGRISECRSKEDGEE